MGGKPINSYTTWQTAIKLNLLYLFTTLGLIILQSKYLPEFHFSEKHSILISASAMKVCAIIPDMDASESWIIRMLLALRGIPAGTSKGIEGWKKMGFVILEHQTDKEIILGLIGQFWKISGEIQHCTAEEFTSFANPEFAKATWNFVVTAQNANQILLETETRIYCPAEKVRKKFKRYWFFIQPFSGLIRKQMLKIIKRKAEAVKK
jgi:hypothetical protein